MTVGPTGGLLGSLAGISSGSGSARLGLSQKGGLPSSGERLAHLVQGRRRAHLLARSRPISFVLDCIFKFALNFRPQSIFLRDRGEAFVIVRVTSAPSPILEILGGFAKGLYDMRAAPCRALSGRERNAVSQPPVPADLATWPMMQGTTDPVGSSS